jgi:hypothetical protein
MLMSELAESIDSALERITRRLIQRLVQAEGGPTGLLAEIRMAALIRRAIDEQISSLIISGQYSTDALLDDILAEPPERPTWREIGEALGVSAQAAQRKYGPAVRRYQRQRQPAGGAAAHD